MLQTDVTPKPHSHPDLNATYPMRFEDLEIHSELVYAECLLLRSILTFIQDENLVSFIKGGLKIRACYQSYKECLR